MQKNQCLNKRFLELNTAYRKFLDKSFCIICFCNLSRINYQNIFYFGKQFRFITIVNTKKIVKIFNGNNIDTLKFWKISLESIEQEIFMTYVRKGNSEPPRLSMSPFPDLFKQVKALNESYCFLVSMILKQNYNIIANTRIFSKSLFIEIEKLQQ